MNKIIVSGFADEFDNDLTTFVEGFKNLGIKNIEVRFVNGKNIADLTKKEIISLKTYLDENDISVSAVGSPLGKVTLDDNFSEHLEKCKRVYEYAGILGTKFIRMFSFYPHKGEEFCTISKKEVFERLEKMIDVAEEYGVVLCHENEENILGESPENCFEILKHFNGRLKCVFDMGNFCLAGYDPVKAYELLKDYVAYFHIKDSTTTGAIVPPGAGDAKIREILEIHAKRATKPFVVSLEPHLVDFCGLKYLVQEHTVLKKEISYKNSHEAFTDASNRFFEIVKGIQI